MGRKNFGRDQKLVSEIAEIPKEKIPNMRFLADIYRLIKKQLKRQEIC
ncbi:MAG: hypothetical protein J7K71_01560 [Candidatus Omnitrophica bacterium]|nr:hypothetical protein [Candidatus Omnitrophota bacterium]